MSKEQHNEVEHREDEVDGHFCGQNPTVMTFYSDNQTDVDPQQSIDKVHIESSKSWNTFELSEQLFSDCPQNNENPATHESNRTVDRRLNDEMKAYKKRHQEILVSLKKTKLVPCGNWFQTDSELIIFSGLKPEVIQMTDHSPTTQVSMFVYGSD